MPTRSIGTPRWFDGLLIVESLFIYGFLWVPILILVLFSLNDSRQVAVWKGFTLHWYYVLLTDEVLLAALVRSCGIAFLTTVLCIVLGTPAALALSRYQLPGKRFVEAMVDLPIIVPEIVLASSLTLAFALWGLRLSLATVVLSHVAFSVSYMIITIRARLVGFDRRLEEAAMDLGADELTTFRRITLPLIAPGILAGALLVFTISLDDYVITSFVAGVGSTTLPIQIYSMVKQGISPEINAASTFLLMATLVLVGASQFLQRSQNR